jgi:hypothetical protein
VRLHLLFTLLFLANIFPLHAQEDISWWNNKHQWDGTTHWRHYIILSPAFLGPNALPVPEFRPAHLSERSLLEMGGEGHFSKGDQTRNLHTSLVIPLGEKANFLIFSSPIEYYKLDSLTRDERRSRDYYSEGYAYGDLYFGTRFYLWHQRKATPDITAGAYFRTPSGGKLSAARHTDTPGYYFSVEISRNYQLTEGLFTKITPYLNLGFYVWQVMRDDNLQNDAFLYGAGVKMSTKSLEISSSAGGYQGYFHNGDAPLVLRLDIGQRREKRKSFWNLRLQQGLRDFPYSSARGSYTFGLSAPKNQLDE